MDDVMALLVADIYQAAGLERRLGEQIARAEGQTHARWQVLFVLADGPLTVAQVARRLGTARQAIQRVARELADDGLLSSAPNPDHRTSPLFSLTGRGREILNRMDAAAGVHHRAQLQQISEAEVVQLRVGLRRLIAALED